MVASSSRSTHREDHSSMSGAPRAGAPPVHRREKKSQDVTSNDVNAYLKEITGQDITAKDFRNWAGTVLAAMALNEVKGFDSEAEAKRNLRTAMRMSLRAWATLLPFAASATCIPRCYLLPGRQSYSEDQVGG